MGSHLSNSYPLFWDNENQHKNQRDYQIIVIQHIIAQKWKEFAIFFTDKTERERKQETGAEREDADLDIEKSESTGEWWRWAGEMDPAASTCSPWSASELLWATRTRVMCGHVSGDTCHATWCLGSLW